ncbi:hypothetical protein BV509_17475 [Rhodovulum sulfidophilum]|uniref:Tail terminator n=1 Tax=Rhodovulum visakhapatnamense TaxID=364297 RepID=A0ABS1RNB8_9RHOB|nr:hypothetical protein [Rhodovulum visakhapatnamense]MBL3580649.1 hypothetical protein [Rhodovulum visakhapatnamense]OLS45969.1 hypothetical protein BV509_17475 [Rhodovulum sulfidophilum]
MFASKAIRHAIADLLEAADIAVDTPARRLPVTILRSPPSGGWVKDDALPGIYMYLRREEIRPATMTRAARTITMDLILEARGADAEDQLDDMQLAVERTIAASANLGGLVMEIRPVDAEIHIERGSAIFGARRLSWSVRVEVPRSDPSL